MKSIMDLDQLTELIHWYKKHNNTKVLIAVDNIAISEPHLWVRDLVLLAQMQIDLILILGASFNDGDRQAIITKEKIELDQQQWFKKFSHIRQILSSIDLGASIDIIEGTFITAKPKGIINGTDTQYAGEVINVFIDEKMLNRSDERAKILCISPFAYADSGKCLLLEQSDLCQHISNALNIEKLIIVNNDTLDIKDISQEQQSVSEVSASTLRKILDVSQSPSDYAISNTHKSELQQVSNILAHSGLQKIHWVKAEPGALLQELYTEEGAGVLICSEQTDIIRQATIKDLGYILKLLKPEEEKGRLVKRSRDKLEQDIDCFWVLEVAGEILACGALIETVSPVEIAALCTQEKAKNKGFGTKLITHLEKLATLRGYDSVVVLTTQAASWFEKRNFKQYSVDMLSVEKQKDYYNYSRNSAVLVKTLKS